MSSENRPTLQSSEFVDVNLSSPSQSEGSDRLSCTESTSKKRNVSIYEKYFRRYFCCFCLNKYELKSSLTSDYI
jgi:hypothetical protein